MDRSYGPPGDVPRVDTRASFIVAPRTGWLLWAALLFATAALSFWCSRSSNLPLDDRSAHFLYYHHHFFPFSNQFWEYLNVAGQVPTIIVVAFVAALLLGARRRFVEAGLMLLALPMGLVQLAVRALVDRPVFAGVREFGRAYPSPSSYPSGHAFGEFLVFGLIFVFAPAAVSSRASVAVVRVLCVAIILFGGLERLVDVRHWPSDVIGAYMLALLYVSAAWWASRTFGAVAET